ncbi:uncharacterized protein EHS24_002531 [Apiotrichum porosum]|uniref:Uncharacterized protein n=1 Tax=Apiotrichum porosum TaxID=105984 RepID=A0A427XGQ6_9TREE|nr:uncharacterized protein EHS24_002531 [Apiotrichum porosum]RSH78075.1 hypothetical protein EHS24_002531 [Apiotrichum porosum]
MPTRQRAPAYNTRLATHQTSSSSARLSSHTFTLIASWRGQLLICTVVLVLGAIYFVVHEPVRKWRRRQRERLSRAFTAELLSMDKSNADGKEDKDRASTSTATSTAVSTSNKNARERAREKRKEAKEAKKRSLLRAVCTGDGSVNTSLNSSPGLIPTTSADSVDDDLDRTADASEPQRLLSPPTITLESSQSDGEGDISPSPEPSLLSESPVPSSPGQPLHGEEQHLESPQAGPSRLSPIPALEIDLSDDMSELIEPASDNRPPYSRVSSGSYSIIPDEGYLPLSNQVGKKKKRKSKARSATSDGLRTPEIPRVAAFTPSRTPSRSFTMSSDDQSPPQSVAAILTNVPSVSAPGSPSTPRRRRKISIGGVPMSPALELLITNHERTIDSLRAEIGHAKAEESKAHDDEIRAREELRRSRSTEDRMRADYERARKARDRAEAESRRLESEILLMRNRFETLTHMYHAVCHRLREVEAGGQDGAPTHVSTPSQMATPYMAFPASGMQGAHMGFIHYSPAVYPSPIPPQFPMATMASPYRRSEAGMGISDLAGPLTPGQSTMPSTVPSQASSPYPSDLTLNTSIGSSSQAASDMAQLSAAELRRHHITSSVLKKKKTETSESGDSNPTPSTKTSDSAVNVSSESGDSVPVAGLGISQMSGVQSTFPSANGSVHRQRPTKQGSMSSASSDASSGLRRQILITPSNTEMFHPEANGHLPETLGGEGGKEDFAYGHDHIAEPLSQKEKQQPELSSVNHDSDDDHLDCNGDTESEFAPMFASLAHTPEQLAEIARIREEAIRDRERRTRARSTGSSDL